MIRRPQRQPATAPRRPDPRGRRRCRRPGVTSMLAMMYLILFGSLAVGFYAAVNTGVQISKNEVHGKEALLTAESGMAFTRHLLANVEIPHGTTASDVWNLVRAQVREQVDDKPVLNGGRAVEGPGMLELRNIAVSTNGPTFTVRLTQSGDKVLATVLGRAGGTAPTARGIQMEFAKAMQASAIFDYGVASRSPIDMNSNARITGASNQRLGSLLSTTSRIPALTMSSNAQISGDASFTADTGAAINVSGNATVAGYKPSQSGYGEHVHLGVESPEFPTIDTTAFRPFAGNPTFGGTTITAPNQTFNTGILRNVLIKAKTNPTFDSNMEVHGVIYIESPNNVKFSSNVKVRGAIVVDNNRVGDTSTNSISFSSNATLYPISSLPATTYFPPALRALTGAIILAPNYNVHFNSNFGSVGGSIIAGKMHFDANASGTVKGSVINLDDTAVQMNSNSTITIESQGTSGYPSGVYFGSVFAPLPDTYQELAQ